MEYVTREHFDKTFDDFGKKIDQKIDALAHAVADGFLGVDKRFDRLEGRVDGVEGRLDRIEVGFIGLRSDHAETQARIARLEEHHERTFKRIDEFLTLVERHETEISALRGGLQRVEERLGEG